jgi:catechol 2,3-dioxygenase-like lactoylglutathione lyase family enzyme
MTVEGMNHFTILTDDVERTVGFYGEFLGLTAGPRPDFAFPGAWLYANGSPILHVIGGRPKAELKAGVIDHMAFSGRDLPAMLQKLEARGLDHVCRRQVGSGAWQVFIFDPNGARVEIDFPAEERAPGRG